MVTGRDGRGERTDETVGEPGNTDGAGLDRLNLVLLFLLLAGSVYAWPSLPARIPRHFDVRGVPDAWGETSLWSWFMLPLLAVGMVLLLRFVGRLTVRRPALLNIPSKKQFLELPPEEQAPILAELRRLMSVLSTMLIVLFGVIQLATYRAAFGHSTQGMMLLVLVLAVVMGPVLAIVMIVRSQRQVSEAYRRAQLRGTLRR